MLPPPLKGEEEKRMLLELEQGNESARQTLVEHNLRLVVYLAKKFENTGICVEDLISIGTIGLIKGINTFNPNKNIKLATYASRCIENEILMYFRSQRKNAQDVSLSEAIETGTDGASLSLMDVVCEDCDLLEQVSTRQMVQQLRSAMNTCLTEQERQVICLRYGLAGKAPQRQREVAAQTGISRSYVSQSGYCKRLTVRKSLQTVLTVSCLKRNLI